MMVLRTTCSSNPRAVARSTRQHRCHGGQVGRYQPGSIYDLERVLDDREQAQLIVNERELLRDFDTGRTSRNRPGDDGRHGPGLRQSTGSFVGNAREGRPGAEGALGRRDKWRHAGALASNAVARRALARARRAASV
jgi:hypothetical protein